MSEDVSPSDAVRDIGDALDGLDVADGSEAAEKATDDPGEEATDAADDSSSDESSSGGRSLKDGLLSTKPDLSVEKQKETLGTGDAGAHGYVGVRKFIGGFLDAGKQKGTTALEHFGMAGLSKFLGTRDQGGDVDGDDQGDNDNADVGGPAFGGGDEGSA